jgi:uncharacterized membrane protein
LAFKQIFGRSLLSASLIEIDNKPTRRAVWEKGRLEAFSDGVIAIIITIIVLEFKVPHGEQLPLQSRWQTDTVVPR